MDLFICAQVRVVISAFAEFEFLGILLWQMSEAENVTQCLQELVDRVSAAEEKQRSSPSAVAAVAAAPAAEKRGRKLSASWQGARLCVPGDRLQLVDSLQFTPLDANAPVVLRLHTEVKCEERKGHVTLLLVDAQRHYSALVHFQHAPQSEPHLQSIAVSNLRPTGETADPDLREHLDAVAAAFVKRRRAEKREIAELEREREREDGDEQQEREAQTSKLRSARALGRQAAADVQNSSGNEKRSANESARAGNKRSERQSERGRLPHNRNRLSSKLNCPTRAQQTTLRRMRRQSSRACQFNAGKDRRRTNARANRVCM